MDKPTVKLILEFACKSTEQAEKFSDEAYRTFMSSEEYPHMIVSSIYENGVHISEIRNETDPCGSVVTDKN